MIDAYDPNIRWATTTVEITYMLWDYSLKIQIDVGGKSRGMSILAGAVEQHADELFDDQGINPKLILTKPSEDGIGEDTLEGNPYDNNMEGDIEEWLNSMCVCVKIITHIEKPTK